QPPGCGDRGGRADGAGGRADAARRGDAHGGARRRGRGGGLMLAAALVALLAVPQVDKVEPPGWWPGRSLGTVRVLMSGRELRGARVDGAPGLSVLGKARVNDRGTHLF